MKSFENLDSLRSNNTKHVRSSQNPLLSVLLF